MYQNVIVLFLYHSFHAFLFTINFCHDRWKMSPRHLLQHKYKIIEMKILTLGIHVCIRV